MHLAACWCYSQSLSFEMLGPLHEGYVTACQRNTGQAMLHCLCRHAGLQYADASGEAWVLTKLICALESLPCMALLYTLLYCASISSSTSSGVFPNFC